MNDCMREIKELRDRVYQLETAIHVLIEAVQATNPSLAREKASEAFERMPI